MTPDPADVSSAATTLQTAGAIASASGPGAGGSTPPARHHDSSIKETLISLVISFVMALVFRSYVVEAFVIPTGSMAPTLLGQHMLFHSEQSGMEWAVNPWYLGGPGGRDLSNPLPVQGPGPGRGAPVVTDPVSTTRLNPIAAGSIPPGRAGFSPHPADKVIRSGDRILVFKFLYQLFDPKRFDVVVFKNPENSEENFIKRLIGLPNEQVWIADGDIFARPIEKSASGEVTPRGEWKVQRKPRRVQNDLWRLVYSSEYAPLAPVRDGRRWFSDPWSGDEWQTEGRREYRCDTAAPTTLRWDTEQWPLWDWVPYNEAPMVQRTLFPVSDLRLRANIKPDQAGLAVIAAIRARGHEFQAVLGVGSAQLRMRRADAGDAEPWTTFAASASDAVSFEAGRVASIEFWHVDQALELHVDGRLVCRGEYDWGPGERLLHATGTPGDEFTELRPRENRLIQPATYEPSRPEVRWEFSGSPLTLFRVGLDRDVYYRADQQQSPITIPGEDRGMEVLPGLGTHPLRPASLGPDQFFCLGDNSPASKDGRLWTTVDPWVADELDREVGIVPRDLMLGKAFFVYFPAPYPVGSLPIVPDVGRMRFIR